MTNNLQSNIKDLEIKQKKFIMFGGIINQNQKKLSQSEIKKLKKDYRKMYFGFVSINWGMGKTLGVSWQKALEQMDGFITSKSKTPNHPVNDELIKIHTEFRRDMAKTIMTNPYTNEKLNEKFKQFFMEDGTKSVKIAKNSLEDIYKKYMPEQTTEKTSTAKSFGLAQRKAQQLMQQMLMQQQTNQYAA